MKRASHGEHRFASIPLRGLAASALAVAMGFGIYGCGGGGGHGGGFGGTPQGSGGVAVQATDAAFPYDLFTRADITLGKIQLRTDDGTLHDIVPAEAFVSTATMNNNNCNTAPTTSGTTAVTNTSAITQSQFDLLSLRNGNTVTTANGVAPIGSYRSVVVTITGMSLTLSDGRTLAQPQNPLPVTAEFQLVPGMQLNQNDLQTILIDFDLARSVTLIGTPTTTNVQDITGFTFTPQGRAMVRNGQNGTVSGFVTDQNGSPVNNAEVVLLNSGSTIATTPTDQGGSYTFLEVAPGSYAVIAIKNDVAGISSSVNVTANSTSQVNLTLNQPAPQVQ